jgi:predicted phosphate transport protein (TIGR00153 family)
MNLLPRKKTFFDLFEQHASSLVDICQELRDLLHHFDRLEERQARIKALEHQCDEITHSVFTEMHASFITPLDKEDITSLASGLDDIADFVEAAGIRFLIYRIPEASPESTQLADLLLQCVQVLQGAVSCLRGSRDLNKVINACREIHGLENQSDTVYHGALERLFNTPGIDPIQVIKWKEIYEHLEMAVDKCEDVANVVEAIQLKYS